MSGKKAGVFEVFEVDGLLLLNLFNSYQVSSMVTFFCATMVIKCSRSEISCDPICASLHVAVTWYKPFIYFFF